MPWRPLPPEPTQPGAPINRSLDALTKRLGLASTQVSSMVFSSWPKIVGPAIAEHSRPLTLRDGVLKVVVDDNSWLTQLKWAAPNIVKRLNEAMNEKSQGFPQETVEKIELRLE